MCFPRWCVVIVEATLTDLLSVLGDLRPEDRAEYEASMGTMSHGAAASLLLSARPFCWAILHGVRPVAFIAAHRKYWHRYDLSMAATPEWPCVAGEMTRWIGAELFPTLWKAGCRRAEALMVDGHPTAGRWMRRLGAVHEAEMPLAGINGETMHLYAWRASDAERVAVDPQSLTRGTFLQQARKISDTAVQRPE